MNNSVTFEKLKSEHHNVCAYVRVSTDYDLQLNSYESQYNFFEDLISNNTNWDNLGVYGDEGISGTKSEKRVGLLNVVKLGLTNKVDLILTKSISRFARNALDLIQYVRMLKKNNVGVYFIEENIYTLDMQGELLLTVLGSVAEQESKNLSEHVSLASKMKADRGEFPYAVHLYGYDWNSKDKKATINEKEYKIIRKMVERRLNGESFGYIAYLLNKEGDRTRDGHEWTGSRIQTLLYNKNYTGDICIKIKVDGEDIVYTFKKFCQPIMSKEEYNIIQRIKNIEVKNRKKYKERTKVLYLFSKKIKCGFCGRYLTCHKKQGNRGFICSARLKNFMEGCPNAKVYEENLMLNNFVLTVNKLIEELKKDKYPTSIKNRLSYLNEQLKNINELKEYDDKLFKTIINYLIIGETINGIIEPYYLTFVIKEDNLFNYMLSPDKKINEDGFYTLVEFDVPVNFKSFSRDPFTFKSHTNYIKSVRVRAVIDTNEDLDNYKNITFNNEYGEKK